MDGKPIFEQSQEPTRANLTDISPRREAEALPTCAPTESLPMTYEGQTLLRNRDRCKAMGRYFHKKLSVSRGQEHREEETMDMTESVERGPEEKRIRESLEPVRLDEVVRAI